ncbi:MAG TPA: acylphosphatase, partial [Gammaproteobacteria bacterium]|nr:acylphosphatase [Gammaproteobacteria bacterium]
ARQESRGAGARVEPVRNGQRPQVTEKSASEAAIRYLVAGRVQGVYYRAATAEVAGRLELRGWAKNLPDGRVEVVAAGSKQKLTELAGWLWQGPPAARVDSVQVEEWEGPVPERFRVER